MTCLRYKTCNKDKLLRKQYLEWWRWV